MSLIKKVRFLAVLVLLSNIFSACSVLRCQSAEDFSKARKVSVAQKGKGSKVSYLIDHPDTRDKFAIPHEKKAQLPAPSQELTPEVKSAIHHFTKKQSSFIVRAISDNEQNKSTIEKILKDEGLHSDMANVALIESGFREGAKSPAGAAGVWQFMKSTAKIYGLTVNFFVDERQDLVLSTIAASRHLKDLYGIYGDWYLALAAYNAGRGTVDRAIKKNNNRDFWQIARAGGFCKETVQYVSRFVAASIILKDPKAYGITDTRQVLNSDGVKKIS